MFRTSISKPSSLNSIGKPTSFNSKSHRSSSFNNGSIGSMHTSGVYKELVPEDEIENEDQPLLMMRTYNGVDADDTAPRYEKPTIDLTQDNEEVPPENDQDLSLFELPYYNADEIAAVHEELHGSGTVPLPEDEDEDLASLEVSKFRDDTEKTEPLYDSLSSFDQSPIEGKNKNNTMGSSISINPSSFWEAETNFWVEHERKSNTSDLRSPLPTSKSSFWEDQAKFWTEHERKSKTFHTRSSLPAMDMSFWETEANFWIKKQEPKSAPTSRSLYTRSSLPAIKTPFGEEESECLISHTDLLESPKSTSKSKSPSTQISKKKSKRSSKSIKKEKQNKKGDDHEKTVSSSKSPISRKKKGRKSEPIIRTNGFWSLESSALKDTNKYPAKRGSKFKKANSIQDFVTSCCDDETIMSKSSRGSRKSIRKSKSLDNITANKVRMPKRKYKTALSSIDKPKKKEDESGKHNATWDLEVPKKPSKSKSMKKSKSVGSISSRSSKATKKSKSLRESKRKSKSLDNLSSKSKQKEEGSAKNATWLDLEVSKQPSRSKSLRIPESNSVMDYSIPKSIKRKSKSLRVSNKPAKSKSFATTSSSELLNSLRDVLPEKTKLEYEQEQESNNNKSLEVPKQLSRSKSSRTPKSKSLSNQGSMKRRSKSLKVSKKPKTRTKSLGTLNLDDLPKRSRRNGSSSKASKSSKKSVDKKKKSQKRKKSKGLAESNQGVPEKRKTFKINLQKLEELMAEKKVFGLDSEELLDRELVADSRYKERSMALSIACIAKKQHLQVEYDWDMPILGTEPPSSQEVESICLKSSIVQKKGENVSSKTVHWPNPNYFTVANIVAYEDSMVSTCFYDQSEIESFRFESFFDEHQDEFDMVSDDDEYEYKEINEDDESYDDDEFYEEITVSTRAASCGLL